MHLLVREVRADTLEQSSHAHDLIKLSIVNVLIDRSPAAVPHMIPLTSNQSQFPSSDAE